jgi:FkbM family methyltransferase
MSDKSSPAEISHEELLRNTDVLRVNFQGREVDFRFTNSVYMRNVVLLIFQGQEYPILELPGFSPLTIVDVGANVGATAVYFHGAYPSAQIYCYEPSMENYCCLQENARLFSSNIHVFPYGLLDKDCQLPLYRGTSQTAQNSIVPSPETFSTPSECVRLVKASHEAAERGWKAISILKLDTEGCEVPILTEFLASVPAIDLLYCEYHAEEDRRRIDALVADRFILCWTKATRAHQGLCVYLSKDLAQRYAEIDGSRKSFLDAG